MESTDITDSMVGSSKVRSKLKVQKMTRVVALTRSWIVARVKLTMTRVVHLAGGGPIVRGNYFAWRVNF